MSMLYYITLFYTEDLYTNYLKQSYLFRYNELELHLRIYCEKAELIERYGCRGPKTLALHKFSIYIENRYI